MSFHVKVLIAWIAFNAIYIPLLFLNVGTIDRATATDQDLVEYGLAKPVAVLGSLLLSCVGVVLTYAARGMYRVLNRVWRRRWHAID